MGRTLTALISAAVLIPYLLTGEELRSVWTGTEVRVSAPTLHFLTGKPLERVRNGATVAFDVQLSLQGAGTVLRRTLERFVISYDLWEERFSVTRLGREPSQRKSISHLAQNAAEAWCLENLAVPTDSVAPERTVTIHLEIRADDAREPAAGSSEPGISLTALIDLFSRPARAQQSRWNLTQGPLRLNDIRQKPAQGWRAPQLSQELAELPAGQARLCEWVQEKRGG